MRIEKVKPSNYLPFSELQFPHIQEEPTEAYDLAQMDDESIDVQVTPQPPSHGNSSFDCDDLIASIELSEEEEMLLDYLLPGRQSSRNKCLKTVNYIEFIDNSIKQYKRYHLFNSQSKLAAQL